MGAPRKYDDKQRDAILRLRDDRLSYDLIIDRCSRGIYGLAPFTPSKGTVAAILKENELTSDTHNGNGAPNPIADMKLDVAFDQLAREQMELIGRELGRIRESDGPLDADAMLKLAQTLKHLEPLAKPQPNGKNGNEANKPMTLLGTIGAVTPARQEPQQPGPRRLRPAPLENSDRHTSHYTASDDAEDEPFPPGA